jgi:hypothetical protein
MRSLLLKLFPKAFRSRDVTLTFIGALAGLACSHIYYLMSESDLKADAEERKRVEVLIIRGIESLETIKYARDPAGKVTGVTIELKAVAAGSASATGDLSTGTK